MHGGVIGGVFLVVITFLVAAAIFKLQIRRFCSSISEKYIYIFIYGSIKSTFIFFRTFYQPIYLFFYLAIEPSSPGCVGSGTVTCSNWNPHLSNSSFKYPFSSIPALISFSKS